MTVFIPGVTFRVLFCINVKETTVLNTLVTMTMTSYVENSKVTKLKLQQLCHFENEVNGHWPQQVSCTKSMTSDELVVGSTVLKLGCKFVMLQHNSCSSTERCKNTQYCVARVTLITGLLYDPKTP